MSGRSVTPDGEKIKALRIEHGWRVEDLATKADVVVRTIHNAEKGKNIDVATLARMAATLGVESKDLLQRAEQSNEAKNLFRLQIVIEADIEKLNNSKQLYSLIELLNKMVAGSGGISILGVEKGSVIVTLEMKERDAHRLIALFPNFHEHAREAIREIIQEEVEQSPDILLRLGLTISREPDGNYRANLRKHDDEFNFDAERFAYFTDMLELAEATTRLVVVLTANKRADISDLPVNEESPSEVVPLEIYRLKVPNVSRDEMRHLTAANYSGYKRDYFIISPEVLRMAGYRSDDDSKSV